MTSNMEKLTLYSHKSGPNPWKVAIILEELDVPYHHHFLEFSEMKEAAFTAINPNGRVPALVDSNTGVTVFESGACIDYLITQYDKDHKLHYESLQEFYATRSWAHFQMSGQGPYFGQLSWFNRLHPEKVPSAIERYTNEALRIIGVLDSHLAKNGTGWLVGDRITYADLMFFPWGNGMGIIAPEADLSAFEHYNAWIKRMEERPAVVRALAEWLPPGTK